MRVGALNRTTVHPHIVPLQVGAGAKFGHLPAVYRHAAGKDQRLGRTSRGNTGGGDQFL